MTALGLAVATATVLAACSDDGGAAGAEDYPSEDITLIVPFPAGSGPDSAARTLATAMEDDLGQKFVIQNKEGGSGTIGLSELAGSDPDGYTISWFASPGLTTQWQRIDTPFDGPEAVEPVAEVLSVVSMLFTGNEELASVDDVVAAAKAAPGEITVALPGQGSQQDIAVRQLEDAAGIELDKNYFDAGGQIQPVVNGTVDLGVAQAAPVVQYVERGDLSWVGVFGSQQPAGIDAPLIADAGYDLDPAAVNAYEGLVAPAGTPEGVVTTLTEAADAAIGSDEFQDYITSNYGAAEYADPEQLQQMIDDGTAVATALIDKYGL